MRRDDRVAVVAQVRSGGVVDGVVDARVQRVEAAEQLAVGGVDHGVDGQRGDVSPPQYGLGRGPEGRAVELLFDRGQFTYRDGGPQVPFRTEERVQFPVCSLRQRTGITYDQQGPQHPTGRVGVGIGEVPQ